MGECFRYNGEEFSEEIGHYFYGFRMYDPAIARFTSVDPIADQFPHVSVFNYAENDPIVNIDLHGLQKVSINDINNSDGSVSSRNVSVTINIKVLNLSSRSNSNVDLRVRKGAAYASSSFSKRGIMSRVVGSDGLLMNSQVPVNITTTVNYDMVSSVDEISDTDHVMMIVDKVDDGNSEEGTLGWGQVTGSLSIAQYRNAVSGMAEVIAHELGHNLGLDFDGEMHTKKVLG